MIPANTVVTCPSCDGEFKIEFDMQEDETIDCEHCDTELVLSNGDLKLLDEEDDIMADEEDNK
jgi:uncharacterized Zn-finger protein